MSLFKLRDAWSTRFPNEEFETRGMVLGDVLNESHRHHHSASSCSASSSTQQIVVGSFAGTVRIFRPGGGNSSSGNSSSSGGGSNNNNHDDLLLEHHVNAPILQVSIAPVVSANENALVILCPRKLLILKIVKAKNTSDNKHSSSSKQQQHADDDEDDGEEKEEKEKEGEEEEQMTSLTSSANSMFQVEIVAELIQQRTAHSFVTGLFGRPPSNIHGICILSMDGNLQFYSGPHASFNRFLPSNSFLVPGAFCYIESLDSFFVGTSTFAIECYHFNTIAGASSSSNKSSGGNSQQQQQYENNSNRESGGDGGGRKLMPDWSFVVGEDILQIKECRLSERQLEKDETEICILAEHSLVILSSKNQQQNPTSSSTSSNPSSSNQQQQNPVVMNIRLDYSPMCMAVFPKPNFENHQRKDQLIISSSTGSYFIHSGNKIVWSAKSQQTNSSPPICVEVASNSVFCKSAGMIIVLTDDGILSLNYLGTDPATSQSVQLLSREELDIVASIKENTELQMKIQQKQRQQQSGEEETQQQQEEEEEEKFASWEPLEITFDPPSLDYNEGLVSLCCYLLYPGEQDLQNVVVVVSGSDPVAAANHTHTIAFLPGKSRVSIPINFGIKPDLQAITPSSLFVEIVASYTASAASSNNANTNINQDDDNDANNNTNSSNKAGGTTTAGAGGKTIVSRTSCALPLGLVCRPIPQVKNSPFKLQIDISNRDEVPPVDQLFDDVAHFNTEVVTPNAISVQFSSGIDGTVLLSKNGCRYRIQSSAFNGLWLLTSELLRRLRKCCNIAPSPELAFEFPDNIPLGELYAVIDAHFEARRQLAESSKSVEMLSEQLRAVQRRLIARFREQNPASMKSMNQLFEVTYRSLRDSCEYTDQLSLNLKSASANLACAVHLTLLVSRYKLKLDREEFEHLRHVLSPAVEDSITNQLVGWEETTVTGLTHLLRTTLSASRGAAGDLVVAQPLSIQTDTSRVKKNIGMVFDRLTKGAKMSQTAESVVMKPPTTD